MHGFGLDNEQSSKRILTNYFFIQLSIEFGLKDKADRSA